MLVHVGRLHQDVHRAVEVLVHIGGLVTLCTGPSSNCWYTSEAVARLHGKPSRCWSTSEASIELRTEASPLMVLPVEVFAKICAPGTMAKIHRQTKAVRPASSTGVCLEQKNSRGSLRHSSQES